MKTILILLAILTLSSCKKEFTCKCQYGSTVFENTLKNRKACNKTVSHDNTGQMIIDPCEIQ